MIEALREAPFAFLDTTGAPVAKEQRDDAGRAHMETAIADMAFLPDFTGKDISTRQTRSGSDGG